MRRIVAGAVIAAGGHFDHVSGGDHAGVSKVVSATMVDLEP